MRSPMTQNMAMEAIVRDELLAVVISVKNNFWSPQPVQMA